MSYWIQYPNLTFASAEHVYRWNGIKKRSVSKVLESVGISKSNGFFESVGYSEFAKGNEVIANFGSSFHKVASARVTGKSVKYPESMESWIKQLDEFLKLYPIVPMYDSNGNPIVEYPMYSVKLDYCGMPDFVGFNANRELIVLDWKTSSSMQKHYWIQTSAYAQLVREVFKYKGKIKLVIVRFDEDRFQFWNNYDSPEYSIFFNSCNNILKLSERIN